jgi:hypothetical protein
VQYVIVAVLFTLIGYSSYGQTHFESGSGWGTAGWNAYTAYDRNACWFWESM